MHKFTLCRSFFFIQLLFCSFCFYTLIYPFTNSHYSLVYFIMTNSLFSLLILKTYKLSCSRFNNGLNQARVMLIGLLFTFLYRAENSPSLFTYQTLGCWFKCDICGYLEFLGWHCVLSAILFILLIFVVEIGYFQPLETLTRATELRYKEEKKPKFIRRSWKKPTLSLSQREKTFGKISKPQLPQKSFLPFICVLTLQCLIDP